MSRREGWVLALAVLLALSLPSSDALGLLRVGGGVGFADGGPAPIGRIALEVLPLLLVALSLDVEYWRLLGRDELLPFLTMSARLILGAELGIGAVLALPGPETEGGVRLRGPALKAGMGVFLGPLGLFAETLLLPAGDGPLAPPLRPTGELRFALGITLGF
jgi:hypothetical protein